MSFSLQNSQIKPRARHSCVKEVREESQNDLISYKIHTFSSSKHVLYSWLYLTEILSEMLRTCLNGHKDRSREKLFL